MVDFSNRDIPHTPSSSHSINHNRQSARAVSSLDGNDYIPKSGTDFSGNETPLGHDNYKFEMNSKSVDGTPVPDYKKEDSLPRTKNHDISQLDITDHKHKRPRHKHRHKMPSGKRSWRHYWIAFKQMARMFLATLYLCYVILTIPLSFEVGGLDCGLSFSFTILVLYFVLATFRVLRYHRFLSTFLYYMQHLFLPSILSLFLTIFTSDTHSPHNFNSSASSTFSSASLSPSVSTSFFSKLWWNYILEGWKLFLVNATPLFTILEGFCTLLSIQAVGQVSQFLIRHRSDTWSIANLIISSCILLSCLYFVVKIYVSPDIDVSKVGMVTASLLGSAFTCTTLIAVFGVSSGRASPLECSLLVAYIVKCSYELFPELSKRNFTSLFKFIMDEFKKIDSQANSLNRDFLKSVHNAFKTNTNGGLMSLLHLNGSLLVGSASKRHQILSLFYVKCKDFFVNVVWRFIAENLPRSFEPLWDFFKISMSNLTAPILIQLAFRIGVFFAATKIIPILQPIQHYDSPLSSPANSEASSIFPVDEKRKTEEDTSDEEEEHKISLSSTLSRARPPENTSTSLKLLYLYSPCIIIAIYTNLMIQYNDDLDKQNHFWNWLKATLASNLAKKSAGSGPLLPKAAETIAGEDVHLWQFWNWVNIFLVLLLYFSELVNHDPDDNTLTEHWA